jgi:hypothetical protein
MDNLHATIYRALGIAPTQFFVAENRHGKVIADLYDWQTRAKNDGTGVRVTQAIRATSCAISIWSADSAPAANDGPTATASA